jgi:hypothetical protein
MLDIILIQHDVSGINLLEFRQKHTKIDEKHSDIFSGFLSAIQNITKELDIGSIVLISTQGKKGHNCIIIKKEAISVIILVDQDDPVDIWRETGELIAEEFIKKYGKDPISYDITQFEGFKSVLQNICRNHNYCEET